MSQEPEPLPAISSPETNLRLGLISRLRRLTWQQLSHSPYFWGGILGLLTLTLSWLIWYQSGALPRPTSLPTPEPTVAPPSRTPSPWATDSAILELTTTLASLSAQIEATDMTEADLNPPLLDLEVSFE